MENSDNTREISDRKIMIDMFKWRGEREEDRTKIWRYNWLAMNFPKPIKDKTSTNSRYSRKPKQVKKKQTNKYNHITVKLLKICNKEKILKTEEIEDTTFKGWTRISESLPLKRNRRIKEITNGIFNMLTDNKFQPKVLDLTKYTSKNLKINFQKIRIKKSVSHLH